MPEGRVIKAYSGHYYVSYGDTVVDCKLRGRFRKEDKDVLVGDMVSFTCTDPGCMYGVIEDVLPRKTRLLRPLVANIDQAVVIIACSEPEPDLELLDKILVQVEASSLEVLICLNKIDLVSRYAADKLAKPYRLAGYKVIKTSARAGWGIKRLRRELSEKISVFAGPSGVGKSALLNALEPGLRLQTGEVSAKTGRGRHTTRHAELLKIQPGGYVVDTPGFSKLELDGIDTTSLGYLFPEFGVPTQNCRFSTCLHHKEPECGVKEAVSAGEIAKHRHDNYLKLLLEITERERRRGK
ncbi:MAG: ribosome small subunit-dependent GTPase A [Bacillota bacterium]|jgi:ribosome biogenesis GTPase|nr:ribosome small subunit-dependent GTPase A [Bacillota bacterium]MDI9415415.1 ribosome small subunit-dependent GTPase A [Bacillota bacterium]NLD13042.1 ribosome small subunit-dependent GTPase A [Bacillota bacterium]HCD41818.1 ribosome small subunit-dependent GTPase A [Bacillota bacterium]HOB88152.1 ribosome small subunit-dependent GTPase A [Bacillota bacterium]